MAAPDLAAQEEGRSEGERARSYQNVAKNVTPIPIVERQQSKPNIYLPNCTQPKDQYEADLCEQIRMAEAAEDAAKVAWRQYGIGIVGLIGLFITLWFTISAARAATRAAVAAERALTDLERPHVFVEVAEAGLGPIRSDGSYELAGGRFEFRCVNYGRTPAALVEILPEIKVEGASTFPDPIDPKSTPGRELPTGCVATDIAPYPEGDTAMKTYPVELLERGASHNYRVYFIGFVRYRDMIFGNSYINGFCFLYDDIGRRFVRRGDNEKYNYTRKENPAARLPRWEILRRWPCYSKCCRKRR